MLAISSKCQVLLHIGEITYPLNDQGKIVLETENLSNTAYYINGSIIINNQKGEEKAVFELPALQVLPGKGQISIYIKDCKISNIDSLTAIQFQKMNGLYGFYEICCRLDDKNSLSFIAQACTDYSLNKQVTEKIGGKIKSLTENNWVELHGKLEIQTNASNVKIPGSQIPPCFMTLNSTQNIKLLGIPINFRLGLTTINNTDQTPDFYSLSFDKGTYDNMISEKIKKINIEKQKGYLTQLNSLENINKLNRKLNHPYIQEELKKIKLYDSLKRKLTDSVRKKLPINTDSLKNLAINYDKKIKDLENLRTHKDVLQDSLISKLNIDDSIQKLTQARDTILYLMQKGEDIYSIINANKNILKEDPDLESLYNKTYQLKYLENSRKGYDELLARSKKYEEEYNKNKKLYDKYRDFDMNSLQEPQKIAGYLQKNKYIRKIDKYLGFVNDFQTGISFPSYSQFTLNALPVKGVHTELKFKNLSLDYINGTVQNPMVIYNNTLPIYKRKINAAKLGFTSLKGSTFSFIICDMYDKSYPNQKYPDTMMFDRPKRNSIIGGKINIKVSRKTELEGEYYYALYNRDITQSQQDSGLFSEGHAEYYDSIQNLNKKRWYSNVLGRTYQTAGSAYKLKLSHEIFSGKTKFMISGEQVDKNYYSLGVPIVIKNLSRYEVKITQSFFKRKLRIGGLGRYDKENNNKKGEISPVSMDYGCDVQINFPKYPSLNFSYQPVRISYDTIEYRMTNLLFSTGYGMNLFKNSQTINLIYNRQDGYNSFDNSKINSQTMTAIISSVIAKHIFMSANYTFIQMQNKDSSIILNSPGLGISYTCDKFSCSANFRYSLGTPDQKKLDCSLTLSYVIKKILQLRLRLDKNAYQYFDINNAAMNNYDKYNALFIINYSW